MQFTSDMKESMTSTLPSSNIHHKEVQVEMKREKKTNKYQQI